MAEERKIAVITGGGRLTSLKIMFQLTLFYS